MNSNKFSEQTERDNSRWMLALHTVVEELPDRTVEHIDALVVVLDGDAPEVEWNEGTIRIKVTKK